MPETQSSFSKTCADVDVQVGDGPVGQLADEVLNKFSGAGQGVLLRGPAGKDDGPARPPAFVLHFLAQNCISERVFVTHSLKILFISQL